MGGTFLIRNLSARRRSSAAAHGPSGSLGISGEKTAGI